VKAQLRIINADITTLRGRQNRTTISIKEYEKRVEDTFTNEQKLLNLTRDYEMSQKHYQELLQKRLAARISENLEKRQKAEQFRIVDPAKIPERPYKPERGKIIALGSLLSVGLAGTYIFMNEYLRPSYRKPEDFEGSTNLPILASIPSIRISESEDCGLVTVCDPESMESEQYRLLYTRICQVNATDAKTVLAVTSSIKAEGKTLTALNLAIVIARDFGKRTLLLEGDLKNPKILKYLHKTTESGLFEVLSERVDLQSGLIRFTHDNLSVLAAPRDVKSSAMLLNSNEMKDLMVVLKERYEVIIVDTPPALLLPDIHIIKGLVDGIILVVRAGKTPKEAVEKSIEVLGKEKMIGIVLNDQKKPIGKYYRYSYAGSGE
jgi:capsular exopolysaccharide synthesis family protein